jgi:hypothetical protein
MNDKMEIGDRMHQVVSDRDEALQRIVLNAEEGRTFIEMGRQGPKISVVSSDWKHAWCLDEPDKSVPLIEELIPQLETAGPRARKCAEEGKKIIVRWEGLKLGTRKPTEAELNWLARHVKIGPGPSISANSKKLEIVNRAAEIAEKILGTPQVVEREP